MKPIVLTSLFLLLAGGAYGATLLEEDFESNLPSLRERGWKFPAESALVSEPSTPLFASRNESLLLKIDSRKEKSYAEFFIPVKTGKLYQAQVLVKCKEVKPAPGNRFHRGAVMFCQFADKDKNWVGGGSFPTGLQGTRDWELLKVKHTRPIPPGVAYIQLMLGVEGTGTAWFDKVWVSEIDSWDEPELISPREGQVVHQRRPFLSWRADLPQESYRVELSMDKSFPPDKTLSQLVWDGNAVSETMLSPGVWFWRVGIVSSAAHLPFAAIRSFTVSEQAISWPPVFEPLWSNIDSALPTLEFRLHPASEVDTVTAQIGNRYAEVSREGDRFKLIPSKELEERGIHQVLITVLSKKDHLTEIYKERFSNKKPGGKVTFREDKIMEIDGKPFFPLASYRDPSDKLDDFAGLKDVGFNVTHSYLFEEKTVSPMRARNYLRLAYANGLRVFLGYSRREIRKRNFEYFKNWTAELMDEPGLLTWYMMDEPMCQKIPAVAFAEMYKSIKRFDSAHPASLLLARLRPVGDMQRSYAEHCDILWCDPYPIPDRPLSTVFDYALSCRDAAGGKSFWVVLQAHDIRYWRNHKLDFGKHGGEVTRPTADESRCMAHLALSAGAHGLVWYWGPHGHYEMRKDAPTVWSGLRKTVQELNELEPYLVAKRGKEDEIALPAPFCCWSRSTGGKRLLAVVNNSEKAAKLELAATLSGGKAIRDRDRGMDLVFEKGKALVEFPAWGVRIYEWAE